MEHPSSISPPSIRICDYNSPSRDDSLSDYHNSGNNSNIGRRGPKPPSRPISALSSSSSSSSAPTPMTIPGSNEALAPPPLPPPRYIEDLAHGHDSGWKWGNSFEKGQFGQSATLPPIKPTSSLLGGAPSRPPLVRRDETYSFEEESKKRVAMPQLTSGASLPDIKLQDEMARSRDGPTSGSLGSVVPPLRTAYSFQGEKPLFQQSVEQSSKDYDKHLLSKIGKPSSPPRQSLGLSSFMDKEPTALPFHSRHKVSLSSLSIGDGPPRWNSGPPSAAISPGTRYGWGGDYASYRSPSIDSPGPSPMDLDPTSRNRHFGSNGREAASLPSRSNRGSYEQGVFPDSDTDFPMEDAVVNFRQRNSRDRTESYVEGYSPRSRQSMKRRASSPPRGSVFEESHTLHPPLSLGASDHEHRRGSGFPFPPGMPPGARYQGSISSMSSASLRNGSYASSTGLSVGASSMSSYDRPSPGGLSPTSDLEPYEKAFVGHGVHRSNSNISTGGGRLSQFFEPSEGKGPPSVVRKASTQSATGLNISKPNASRIGRHICECCPKKPKKFDTMEELRVHEMEKQYFCRYCNKRFKNKNEAERHQNSLHLRRHSWSCAALASFEAAFHPSATPAYQTPNGPSHDACGYCGVEFTNYPQPEWDRRIDHLTNIHKFGECNQAKKFFRADHFRQHLKHSHAGSSGKWTNILENACMREEPPPDGGLPSIGEHSGAVPGSDRGYSIDHGEHGPPSTMSGITPHTIDEVMDES